MTTVYSIDNVVATDVDVAVPQLDQDTFKLVSAITDLKTGVSITTFTIPTGDPTYPLRVTVRTEKPAKTDAVRRSSITLASWARTVVDDVVVSVKPITATIALNVPAGGLEMADVSDFMGNLYGLTFGSLNTKVPAVDHLSSLMFGITDLFS